jgi:transglutaminase-like putative cysteine protease
MRIRIGFDVTFDCAAPTPMVLMLSVHPSRAGDLMQPDVLRFTPALGASHYLDAFGNKCTRLVAPQGFFTVSADTVVFDSDVPDIVAPDAREVEIADLPQDALIYLRGSRYCETDLLMQWAWARFGNTPRGWRRVQAIVDFVHAHLEFGYGHASATRSATDAFRERRGVCRDFAHLAVALCRCMNIPARYCTGYLGDIGVPAEPDPMDFSAWFEVYLDGRWYTFDARHNVPRIGRILIARGRDAADVAISTTFGVNKLAHFSVRTDEVMEPAAPALQPAFPQEPAPALARVA